MHSVTLYDFDGDALVEVQLPPYDMRRVVIRYGADVFLPCDEDADCSAFRQVYVHDASN